MKKYFIGIILFILGLCIFLNVIVLVNVINNKRILNVIGAIFYKDKMDVGSSYEYEYFNKMSVLEIDGTDYVGVINILKDDLIVPIRSSCDDWILGINSGCRYDDSWENLIVVGTGFSDSFKNYNMYNIGDIIVYMNMLGDNYHYKIKSIKRVDKLDDVLEYDADMILVVRDYIAMEYILFVCDRD